MLDQGYLVTDFSSLGHTALAWFARERWLPVGEGCNWQQGSEKAPGACQHGWERPPGSTPTLLQVRRLLQVCWMAWRQVDATSYDFRLWDTFVSFLQLLYHRLFKFVTQREARQGRQQQHSRSFLHREKMKEAMETSHFHHPAPGSSICWV